MSVIDMESVVLINEVLIHCLLCKKKKNTKINFAHIMDNLPRLFMIAVNKHVSVDPLAGSVTSFADSAF